MSESKTAVARIDGIEYEVAPEVERHIARQDEQVNDLTGKLEAAQAEVETATAKADEAKAEIERLNEQYSEKPSATPPRPAWLWSVVRRRCWVTTPTWRHDRA